MTIELSPSSVFAFAEAVGGARGQLDAWLECNNEAEVRAHIDALIAAERERLLSMPRLMHGCDALGAPADGEHCDLLRRVLVAA